MYIENTRRYYSGTGCQYIARALFLLLIEPKDYDRRDDPTKAIVRTVALKQWGHWMMGVARIYTHSITVSGSYGGDGLPCRVVDEIYDRAQVILPDDLKLAWANGGGWNSAGSEAPLMRKWALDNLKELRK